MSLSDKAEFKEIIPTKLYQEGTVLKLERFKNINIYYEDDVQEAVKALKDVCIEIFHKNDKPEDDLNFVMKKIKEIFGEKLYE